MENVHLAALQLPDVVVVLEGAQADGAVPTLHERQLTRFLNGVQAGYLFAQLGQHFIVDDLGHLVDCILAADERH